MLLTVAGQRAFKHRDLSVGACHQAEAVHVTEGWLRQQRCQPKPHVRCHGA